MTIFFVVANDPQTRANLAVAQKISSNTDVALFGESAIREKLHAALDVHDRTIFSMSHGRTTSIVDNDGHPALEEGDGNLLAGFRVFAWACHTGANLGKKLSEADVIWWGYECPVTAPDDRDQFIDLFADILGTAKNSFISGLDTQSIHDTIEKIKQACDKALIMLDELEAYNDLEAFSLYSCCNQLWQRLLVWIPKYSDPLKHPNAPPAYIDL